MDRGGVLAMHAAREREVLRDSWAQQSRATVDDLQSVLARVAVGGRGKGGDGVSAAAEEEEDLLEKWRSERKARLENNASSPAVSSSVAPQQDAVGRIKRRLAGAAGICMGGDKAPVSAEGADMASEKGFVCTSSTPLEHHASADTSDGNGNSEAISRIRRRLAGAVGSGSGASGCGYAVRMREQVTGKMGEEVVVEEEEEEDSGEKSADGMGDEELGILPDEDDGPSSDDELHLPSPLPAPSLVHVHSSRPLSATGTRHSRETSPARQECCDSDDGKVPILYAAPTRARYLGGGGGGGGGRGGGGGGGGGGGEVSKLSSEVASGGDAGAVKVADAVVAMTERADREMLCVRALSGRGEEEEEEEEDEAVVVGSSAPSKAAAVGSITSLADPSCFLRRAQGGGEQGGRVDSKPPVSPEARERDYLSGYASCLSDELGDSIARLLFGFGGVEGAEVGSEGGVGGSRGRGGRSWWGDATLTNFEVA
jgi:hypothetical protein